MGFINLNEQNPGHRRRPRVSEGPGSHAREAGASSGAGRHGCRGGPLGPVPRSCSPGGAVAVAGQVPGPDRRVGPQGEGGRPLRAVRLPALGLLAAQQLLGVAEGDLDRVPQEMAEPDRSSGAREVERIARRGSIRRLASARGTNPANNSTPERAGPTGIEGNHWHGRSGPSGGGGPVPEDAELPVLRGNRTAGLRLDAGGRPAGMPDWSSGSDRTGRHRKGEVSRPHR